MPISVSLVDSEAQIARKVTNALKKDISNLLNKSASGITMVLRKMVREAIEKSPEYQALNNGQLAWEFGLADGKGRIDRIIEIWTNNINVRVLQPRRKGKGISGGIEIKMIKSDYSDVLASPDAQLSIVTGEGNAVDLTWLNWLLTAGSKDLVLGWDVQFVHSRRSRTGRALMVEDQKTNWSVPPEFSGTPRNNFLTRSLGEVKDDLRASVEKEMRKHFR